MANKRMIHSCLFEDDLTRQLDLFGRFLWIGLIVAVADDQGRFLDNPAIIRARVFPFDDVNDAQVEAVMIQLATSEKIICYTAGGKSLVQIKNWWIYQQPSWASPSRYPAPPNWIDRMRYHSQGNKIITQNWDCSGGFELADAQLHQLFNQLPDELHSELPDGQTSQQPGQLCSPIEEQECEIKIEDEDESKQKPQKNSAAASAARGTPQPNSLIARAWTIATDMPAIPPGDLPNVLPVLEAVSGEFETAEALAAAIKPYYLAWLSRHTSDGRPYSRTNLGWIDWLAVGEIPPVRTDKLSKQANQPSAAEIAAALRGSGA